MDFAVTVVLDAPGTARWVLAVDPVGERLLLTDNNGVLHWVPMAGCKFAKVASPDQPRPVVPIQPKQSQMLDVARLVQGNHG